MRLILSGVGRALELVIDDGLELSPHHLTERLPLLVVQAALLLAQSSRWNTNQDAEVVVAARRKEQ